MITQWEELSFFVVVAAIMAYVARMLAALIMTLAVYVKTRWMS
jgi:hypothetical protein